MNFLGIGTLELVFILLLIIIVLGPKDLPKAGRTLGKMMRSVVMSDTWKAIKQLRYLPNVLMREAGLEEEFKEVEREIKEFQTGQRAVMDGIENDLKKTSQEFPDWIPYKPPQKVNMPTEDADQMTNSEIEPKIQAPTPIDSSLDAIDQSNDESNIT